MNIVSAKRAAEFANIQKTDNRGRVTKVLVPGHGGTWYEVSIRRFKQKKTQVIGTQCNCVSDKTPCKGNANQLCYHSLAALLAGAEKTKVKISFCKDKETADRLTNIGGTSYVVQSLQSDKTVWLIAKDDTVSMPC